MRCEFQVRCNGGSRPTLLTSDAPYCRRRPEGERSCSSEQHRASQNQQSTSFVIGKDAPCVEYCVLLGLVLLLSHGRRVRGDCGSRERKREQQNVRREGTHWFGDGELAVFHVCHVPLPAIYRGLDSAKARVILRLLCRWCVAVDVDTTPTADKRQS